MSLLRAYYLSFVNDKRITCTKCLHSWNYLDGGPDPYTCHSCGYKNKAKLAEGMPHYLADGTLYEGPTHKTNGRLMTGATHTDESQLLYHKDQLAEVNPLPSKHPKA